MNTTADTERRLRDANPTPPDLPKSEAAWSSAELLDRIDLQTRVADAPDSPAVVHRPAHRRRGPLIAIGAALAITLPILLVALFANARPEGHVAATTTTSPTTTIAEVTPPPESEALPATIEITSVNYEYLGLPDAVPAGTSFDFVNGSEDEYHVMYVIRLDSDDERTAQEVAALKITDIVDSEGGERFGSVKAVLGAKPGEPYVMFINGRNRVSEPGRYLILCINTVGHDVAGAAASFVPGPHPHGAQQYARIPPPPGEMDANTPHYAVGEFAGFTVEE
jgi:hypothetical protein